MNKIVAFSGTFIKNGNIEKALKTILEATDCEIELVRLAELDLKQCRACAICAKTNTCVINDDVNPLLEKIKTSSGFIFSGFSSFGSVNALTKTFMERNWPLRHNHIYTKGKVSAAVAGSCSPLGEALGTYFDFYFNDYLLTRHQGSLVIDGVVPCTICGYGETCQVSGFRRRFGPEARIAPDKFYDFDKDPVAINKAKELGQAIGRATRN